MSAPQIRVETLCADYRVRELSESDVPEVLKLYKGNPIYFEHLRFVPEQLTDNRHNSLPPKSTEAFGGSFMVVSVCCQSACRYDLFFGSDGCVQHRACLNSTI